MKAESGNRKKFQSSGRKTETIKTESRNKREKAETMSWQNENRRR
jgi:hypothetical protein